MTCPMAHQVRGDLTVELPFLQNLIFDLSLMKAFSADVNSRHVVQPLAMMYSTWLEISVSESGGRNENVSNTLQIAICLVAILKLDVSAFVRRRTPHASRKTVMEAFIARAAAQFCCNNGECTFARHKSQTVDSRECPARRSDGALLREGCAPRTACNQTQ